MLPLGGQCSGRMGKCGRKHGCLDDLEPRVLSVRGLCTEYIDELGRPVKAAEDVTFDVPEGHFFTLLGPSGCGKTTTLRSIAGLERPRAGEISIDGSPVSAERVERSESPVDMLFSLLADRAAAAAP